MPVVLDVEVSARASVVVPQVGGTYRPYCRRIGEKPDKTLSNKSPVIGAHEQCLAAASAVCRGDEQLLISVKSKS